MKTIFILYMPGHAGNLINRLISLSPETVPQIPKPELIDFQKYKKVLTFSDRLSLYSFKKAENFNNWQDFHRTCVDFLDEDLFRYFYLRQFPGIFSHVVYAIHPYEFYKALNINPNSIIDHKFQKKIFDSIKDFNEIAVTEKDIRQYSRISKVIEPIFYYIELTTKYDNWVDYYRGKLLFQDRQNEKKLFQKLQNDFDMKPIYLDRMLDSLKGFEEEYMRIVIELNLTPNLNQANILYKEWLTMRGPKLDTKS
jgi:hypothetical protein